MMKLLRRFGVCWPAGIASLVFLAVPHMQGSPLMYGITQTGTLFTLNPVTLATSTEGTVAGSISLTGLASNGTNLYTFDRNADDFLQIDAMTANTLNTINTGFGTTSLGEGDFTFNTGTGSMTGFLASAQFPVASLYSFTLGSPGSNTQLYSDNTRRIFIDGMAFGPGGTLFALQQGGTNLYTVNTTTGTPTVLGATGIAAGPYSFGGMAFDSNSNTMYAVLSNNATSNLYTINTTTGAGTLVGAIPNMTNVAGLTIFDANPVGPSPTPEPSTLLLMSAGLVAICVKGASFRRRSEQ
jgi:hypothetical protein